MTATCPKCNAPLADDAPAGLCPKCLLAAALPSDVEPGTDPTLAMPSPGLGSFQAPAIEHLAKLFPQLELLELIGKGGMGAVYKARQPGLDRFVAVKILPPEVGRDPAFAERFMREARAMAKLGHPNIVGIYDFGQTGGLYYFVMEYIDGANLRQTIQTGKLQPAEALAIVPQICDALQYAHDEGIVHRDIKPENILLDKRGRVKIADFGLSKLVHQGSKHDVSLTGTEQIMGTVRYMAPEQMMGTRFVDHRADIYSLGVVFYELLTGDLPMGRFAPPSQRVQIDVRLDEVVLRALEQEPDKRYQHASEVKTGVEDVVGRPNRQSAQSGRTAASRESDIVREARSYVDIPSMGLVISSSLMIVSHAAFFLYGITNDVRRLDEPFYLSLIGVVSGTITLIGAIQMRRLRMRGLAFIGAFVALIPVSPFSFFSFIFGTWAMFVLNHIFVERAFRERIAEEPPTEDDFPGELLLDETDYSARQLQHMAAPAATFLMIGGAIMFGVFPKLWLLGACGMGAACFLYYLAGITKQQWDVIYRGHKIRFDNSVYASGRLYIDKQLVASGGVGPTTQLRGRILEGDGAGDVIVARTKADLLSFRLRLYAQRGGSSFAAAPVVYSRREDVSRSEPDVESAVVAEPISVARPLQAPPKENAPEFTQPAWASHWLSAPAFARRAVEVVLALVYLAALICFFGFTVSNSVTSSGEKTEAVTRIGQPTPWFVLTSTEGKDGFSFSHSLNILSWSVLIAIVGLAALQLIRRLELIEKGKSHSMWWHYTIWSMMLCVVFGLAIFNQYAGRMRPKTNEQQAAQRVTYLTGHNAPVKAILMRPEGRTLVSAGLDGKVIARDLTGKGITEFESPALTTDPGRAPFFGLAQSPTTPTLFAAGNSGVLRFELNDPIRVESVIPTNGTIRFVTLYDSGRKLAYVGNADTEVICYDLVKNIPLGTRPLYEGKQFGNVQVATASPKGRFLALTCSDMLSDPAGGVTSADPCHLIVYDNEQLKVEGFRWQFRDFADFSHARAAFLDDRTLALCIPSGELRIVRRVADEGWKMDDNPIRISPGRFTAAAADANGKSLFLAEGKQIVEIDVASGRSVGEVDLEIGEKRGNLAAFEIEALVATSKPHEVAAALWDGRVAVAKCSPLASQTERAIGASKQDPATITDDSDTLPMRNPPAPEGAKYPYWDGQETIAAYAKRAQLNAVETLDLGEGEQIELALIPAGSFLMGTPDDVEQDDITMADPQAEGPQHKVTFTKPFYMGKYEVTQSQWLAIMHDGPKLRFMLEAQKDPKGFGRHPVETITLDDSNEFCKFLSRKSGREVRLPSEAEWEYACRAGTTTKFFWGDATQLELPNGSFSFANEPHASNEKKVVPVGTKKPNPWGLFDMYGNVAERTLDSYHPNYEGASTDGSVWTKDGDEDMTMVRGGSWEQPGMFHGRSANRSDALSVNLNTSWLGMRVVMEVE